MIDCCTGGGSNESVSGLDIIRMGQGILLRGKGAHAELKVRSRGFDPPPVPEISLDTAFTRNTHLMSPTRETRNTRDTAHRNEERLAEPAARVAWRFYRLAIGAALAHIPSC